MCDENEGIKEDENEGVKEKEAGVSAGTKPGMIVVTDHSRCMVVDILRVRLKTNNEA
jgi:hypothetical protein